VTMWAYAIRPYVVIIAILDAVLFFGSFVLLFKPEVPQFRSSAVLGSNTLLSRQPRPDIVGQVAAAHHPKQLVIPDDRQQLMAALNQHPQGVGG
jgi:hypothetical protein